MSTGCSLGRHGRAGIALGGPERVQRQPDPVSLGAHAEVPIGDVALVARRQRQEQVGAAGTLIRPVGPTFLDVRIQMWLKVRYQPVSSPARSRCRPQCLSICL